MVHLSKVVTGLVMFVLPLLLVRGEDSEPPTLITNSPFLPPGFQPPGQPGQSARNAAKPPGQYEFHGVYKLEDLYYFNLYDLHDKKGIWVNENNAREKAIKIVNFDPETDELVIQVDGKETNLSLIKTSDQPLPLARASAGKATAGPTPGTVNRPTPTVRRRVVRPTRRSPPGTLPDRRPVTNP